MHPLSIADIRFDHLHVGERDHLRQVLSSPDREVVQQQQLVVGSEPIGEMAADEAGGPGDQDPEIRELHDLSHKGNAGRL